MTDIVNSNEYDIVLSHFKSLKKSDDVANTFTGYLFTVANMTEQNVLDILDSFKKTPTQEAMTMLAYYLNSNRSPTSLYGVGKIPVPNQYVQRNVLI